MNIRLKKDYFFNTGLVYDNEFFVNSYALTIDLLTQTEDPDEQNIAYQRINFWISSVLNHSILISEKSKSRKVYEALEQKLILLPREPVDQVLCEILFCKLNAICEKRCEVTQVGLSSSFGDDIVFLHSNLETFGALDCPGWWTSAKPIWQEVPKTKRGNKVIALNFQPEWADSEVDLDWKTKDTALSAKIFEFPKK